MVIIQGLIGQPSRKKDKTARVSVNTTEEMSEHEYLVLTNMHLTEEEFTTIIVDRTSDNWLDFLSTEVARLQHISNLNV